MLTKNEQKLIENLRENSRKNISKISKETKIPISTLFHTLQKLEKTIIKKHTTIINFKKLGYKIRKQYSISTKNKEETKKFLENNKHVNNLSTMMDTYDFTAECLFKNNEEENQFKKELEKYVEIIKETYILEPIKQEGFKP